VAHVEIEQVLDREVLLVERFDRHLSEDGNDWCRRSIVSALTWTQEDELSARHVAYSELAEIIRARFRDPVRDLRELFARMTFNILVGNTDDHARNHAGYWDGNMLELTPAYDIAPQRRGTKEANQALNIIPGERSAQLINVLRAAPHFHINEADARNTIDQQVAAICDNWDEVCDLAGMKKAERGYFAGRQILNSYAFEDFGPTPTLPGA
jgi:serine/threonine-protein kinase HipA